MEAYYYIWVCWMGLLVYARNFIPSPQPFIEDAGSPCAPLKVIYWSIPSNNVNVIEYDWKFQDYSFCNSVCCLSLKFLDRPAVKHRYGFRDLIKMYKWESCKSSRWMRNRELIRKRTEGFEEVQQMELKI